VALLVRSLEEYGLDLDRETYQLLDASIPAPNDRRMREVFTATVGIRNRMRVN
jgi:Type IV Pilus-assembly protein W